MGYITIFFVSFFCGFSLLASGKIFNKYLINEDNVSFFENIIFGCIVLTFLALGINFFFSLNEKLNLIFIILPFFLYFFTDKREIKNDLKYLLLFSFLTVLLISLENTNRPDAGLYHLPYIGILNENNLLVGISNLHFRFGHTSIIQYLSAIYNNIVFTSNGILVPSSIFYLALLGYLINEAIKKRNDKVYSFLSIIFSSYVLINMNRYSSWGNDDYGSILSFLVILNCYQNFNQLKFRSFAKILLFCSFAFFIKSFYIILFLLPFILFLKHFRIHYNELIFNKLNLFNLLFVIFWLIKNFLTTSCFIFPITILCFDVFQWSLSNMAIAKISLVSEAWAKDWPNNNTGLDYKNFVADFNWYKTWLNNHFIIIVKNLSVLISLILIFRIFIDINIDNIQKKFIKIFSVILFFLFLIWFFKFPLLRYGEGILVTFILLLSLNLKIKLFNVNNFKFSIVIIIILSSSIVVKNTLRIVKNYHNVYVDYPWPKKNSHTYINSKNKYDIIKKDGEILYYKPNIEHRLCMYGPSPCAAIDVNHSYFKMKNIEIDKGRFLFFDMFFITNKNN